MLAEQNTQTDFQFQLTLQVLNITNVAYHNSTDFTLSFGSDLNKSACDAAWGIDDVSVYVK